MPDPVNPSKFRVSGPTLPAATNHSTQPIYEMSVANCRKLDDLATTQYAIPSIVLMENASIGLCHHAIEMLKHARTPNVFNNILIATGPGNNAGDGFALARHLSNLGFAPVVVMTVDPKTIIGDAKINLDIITKMSITMIDAQDYLAGEPTIPGLIVDALFGTGLTRPITGIAATLINHINASKDAGALVLAVDVPSGLDAQTGEPVGEAVIIADRTVTFAALKDGYRSIEAQPNLGEVFVAPIGVPTELLESLGNRVHLPRDRT